MQNAHPLQRGLPGHGPDTYLTTGFYTTFELTLRAHGKSPTSSFILCSLLGSYQFPTSEGVGSGCRPLPCDFRDVQKSNTGCISSTTTFEGSALDLTCKSTLRASTPSGRSAWRDEPYEPARAGRRCRAASTCGGCGDPAGRNGASARDRPANEAEARAGRRGSGCHWEPPQRGGQGY